MPPKTQKAKTSLATLLAQQPERPRNDWSNGRPGVTASGGSKDDGFPAYDTEASASSGEEDDEDNSTSAGGAFAVLAALRGGAAEDEDQWIPVSAKPKKKASVPQPAPAPAPAVVSAAPRRPTATSAPPVRPITTLPAASFPRLSGTLGAVPGTSAGHVRAPYSVTSAAAPSPRTPRPQTHDSEGKPISDTYYQTFQKVYRNPSGAVCMRFHKTDVVTVRPNGDVVLTSGGFRTRTTFLSVQEVLQPLGLTLHSSLGAEGRGDWSVEGPDGTRTPWEDGMVLPASSEADRGRGQRLLAAYGGGTAATAPPATATATASAPGPPVRVHTPAPAPSAPAPGPAPTPTSTWSYRSAVGAPLAYAPQLRSPAATAASAAGVSSYAAPAPPSVPVPTPRTAESLTELQQVLSAALAIQGDAMGRGQGAGGGAAITPTGRGPAAAANGGTGAGPTGLCPGGPELDDEHACIACMAALKTTLLIPCGHLVMCGPCAEQVLELSGVCPMCREEVVSTVAVST